MDSTSATLFLLHSSTTIHHLHQIHAQMIKTQQITHSPPLAGRLIAAVSLRHHSRHMPYALSILSRLPSPPDLFTHNSILLGLLRSSSPHLSLLFFSLHFAGHLPNSYTFPLLLKACTQIHSLCIGLALHSYVIKLGLDSNLHIHTALLSFYSTRGDSTSALQLFDQSPHRNKTPTWNAAISGLVKTGKSRDAMDLFCRLLREKKADADEITIVSALAACADLGALDMTRWIHEHAIKNDIKMNVYVGTALVDAYAKCGSIDIARKVFDEMEERNVMSWTAMIRGLAMFGRGDEAITLFDEMVGEGVKPDDVTFVGVLSACSHSGMVGEGHRVFSNMTSSFKLAPKTAHYGCMVDMLSRAGLLDEALDLIGTMPMKADAALWGSLLSACRRNPSNVDLAEYVAGQLLEIEPENESTYVLLSNIYAYHNRWDDVGRLRTWMKAQGIEKTPGCSSVEVSGVVHEFIVGDKSHPQIDKIFAMVKEIENRVGEMGHVMDTSEVLLDIDEDEKKSALLLHSEKLALAFGLIGTERPATVRIVKNLRVCNDCHSVMKLASKAFGREIILRDRNRFHTFREGMCSCGDFW